MKNLEGNNGPDGMGDIWAVVVLMSPACSTRVLANINHASGLLAVSVWDHYSHCPTVCFPSCAPRRDRFVKPWLSTIVARRPDIFTLDWKQEASSHQNETSEENFPQADSGPFTRSMRNHCRRDQFGGSHRVLENRIVGSSSWWGCCATTTQTQPNGANHVVPERRWKSTTARSTQRRPALHAATHWGRSRSERTVMRLWIKNASLRMEVAGVAWRLHTATSLSAFSDTQRLMKNQTNPSSVMIAWAKVTSKKHCQAIPIQLYKRNQTTRNAISVCPKVAEEPVKGDKATSLCYHQTHAPLTKEHAFFPQTTATQPVMILAGIHHMHHSVGSSAPRTSQRILLSTLPSSNLGVMFADCRRRTSRKQDRFGPERSWENRTGAWFLDSRWKLCDWPGKQGQVVLRLLQVQGWSCRRHRLSQHKRKRDRVVHVVSLYGHAGAGDFPEKMRKNELLLRDTFQFLAGLGAVPITILADLNVTPHLSLAVCSAIDVGGWAHCAALVAEATASSPLATCYVHAGPGSRIDVVLANRISKHALCDVGLVGNKGISTHLPVAAVFQFAEYEQIVTTIVRMRKIDLHFKDPEPEAEQLTADRVVAHILCGAGVQKLTCTSERSKGTRKAQTGREQVRLKPQRRRAPAPSAHEGAQNHRTRRLLKLERQVEDLVRQVHRHATMVGGLSVLTWSMLSLWKNLVKDCWVKRAAMSWDCITSLLLSKWAAWHSTSETKRDRHTRTTEKTGWRHGKTGTEYGAACNWCKGADSEKMVVVQREGGTHPTLSKCTHSLSILGYRCSRCIYKARDLPGSSLRPLLADTFPSPANVLSMSWMVRSWELLSKRCRAQVRQELTGGEWPSCRRTSLQFFFWKIGTSVERGRGSRHMPVPLTRGLISLRQKGDGSAPQKLRPTGLMASVYRLWASLRVRDTMHW